MSLYISSWSDKTYTDKTDADKTDKWDKTDKADKTDTDKTDKLNKPDKTDQTDQTEKADDGWNIKIVKCMYDGSRGKIILGLHLFVRNFVQFWCQALPFTVPIQLWVLLFWWISNI